MQPHPGPKTLSFTRLAAAEACQGFQEEQEEVALREALEALPVGPGPQEEPREEKGLQAEQLAGVGLERVSPVAPAHSQELDRESALAKTR